MRLSINGEDHEVEVDPATPLLWVLRDELGLVGTKFGCGVSQCGACTVQLAGNPVRSCTLPVAAAEDRPVTTVEGLAAPDGTLSALQQAWIEHDVPQCGYCQAGQLVTATALLASNPNPNDAEIDAYMAGNICRCGTYQRIRAAIKSAAGAKSPEQGA